MLQTVQNDCGQKAPAEPQRPARDLCLLLARLASSLAPSSFRGQGLQVFARLAWLGLALVCSLLRTRVHAKGHSFVAGVGWPPRLCSRRPPRGPCAACSTSEARSTATGAPSSASSSRLPRAQLAKLTTGMQTQTEPKAATVILGEPSWSMATGEPWALPTVITMASMINQAPPEPRPAWARLNMLRPSSRPYAN